MRKLRYGILLKRIVDFAGQKNKDYTDKCQWNITRPEVCKRYQYNKHKNNAARSKKAMTEKKGVKNAGNTCCCNYHDQELFRPVSFFKDRSNQENECEITHKMGPVLMAHDMRKNSPPG